MIPHPAHPQSQSRLLEPAFACGRIGRSAGKSVQWISLDDDAFPCMERFQVAHLFDFEVACRRTWHRAGGQDKEGWVPHQVPPKWAQIPGWPSGDEESLSTA